MEKLATYKCSWTNVLFSLVQPPNASSRLLSHLKVAIWLISQNVNISFTFCDCGGNCNWAVAAFSLLGKEEPGEAAVLGVAGG